jgi:hypothetical protein
VQFESLSLATEDPDEQDFSYSYAFRG